MVQMDFESGSGKATNNTAEYEGLLAGLRVAAGLGIKRVVVRGDSQLIVRQVTREYSTLQMRAYLDEVRKLERHFDGIQIEHIPRGENLVADEPCVYHCREGFPCKHTIAECHSLKEIEKARRIKGNNGHNGHNGKNKGPDPAQERNDDPRFEIGRASCRERV